MALCLFYHPNKGGAIISFWGGSSWTQTPQSQGYIDPIFNFDPGSSRGSNLANQWLKGVKKGQDIGQYSFLNPIRDYGAARMRDAEQQSQAQGIELADQPVLRQRLENLQKNRIGEQTGMQMGQALEAQIPGWMQLSESSNARKAAQKLQALIAAGQLNQASWMREQKMGLFDKIKGITGLTGDLVKAGAGVAGAF